MTRRALPLLALLGLALIASRLLARRGVYRGPMEVGMWYWHSPFALTDADRAALRKMGVGTLYVRAATFANDGHTTKPTLLQTWRTRPDGLNVVLVFDFHPGLVRHLDSIPEAEMTREVTAGIRAEWARARAAGVNPSGVQLDLDCPTRLLPRLAGLLRASRGAIPSGATVSATVLPTWLTASAFDRVADAADFLAPQFYEGRTGMTVTDVQPIEDPQIMRRALDRLASLGKPFEAGIAAYGHAMLFDRSGRLCGMVHDLAPEDALRLPSLEPESVRPMDSNGRPATASHYIGEDLLVLRAVRPDPNGHGLGYRVAYVLPTPRMVDRQLRELRAERPDNCRGIILYRFPEPNEALCLSLDSQAAGLRGQEDVPGLDVRVRQRAAPWSQIGGDQKTRKPPQDLTVEGTATGGTPTLAWRDAVSVLLRFDGPGLAAAAPGDFDDVRIGRWSPAEGGLVPCGLARADTILLRRFHLAPGERIRSGTIALAADGPAVREVLTSVRAPGGFASSQARLTSSEVLR